MYLKDERPHKVLTIVRTMQLVYRAIIFRVFLLLYKSRARRFHENNTLSEMDWQR